MATTSNESIIHFFTSLRNGTLLQELDALWDDQCAKAFLPTLMLAAFPPTHSIFSSDVNEQPEMMDALRAQLIEVRLGNELMHFLKLDFTAIATQCETEEEDVVTLYDAIPFFQMDPHTKVLHIAEYLIKRGNKSTDSFLPFDNEHCEDEVVWIICLLIFFQPTLFDPLKVCRVLLSHSQGPKLIQRIVLNNPEIFDALLEQLMAIKPAIMTASIESDTDSHLLKQRRDSLFMLLQLDPEQTERCFSAAIVTTSTTSYMRLAVDLLCCPHLSDTAFIGLLFQQLRDRSGPLTQFLTKASRSSFKRVCERIGRVISNVYVVGTEQSLTQLKSTTLLVALVCSYSVRLSNEETRQWMHFLTQQQQQKDQGVLKLALAALLTCPTLTPNQLAFKDEAAEAQLTAFFQWIRVLTSSDTTSATATEYSSLSRLMLLVAIHLGSNREEELASLLSSVLGFKVGNTLRKVPTVRTLFLKHAVTERDVAEKAAKIEVTKSLNAKSSGYLPVHCITHLLSSRTFSKHQIPIQDWIKKQLRECTAPIHPSMVSLLENYARSCVPSPECPTFNRPIDEEFFSDMFSPDLFTVGADMVLQQVMCLFYLMAYSFRLNSAPLLLRLLPPPTDTENSTTSICTTTTTTNPTRYSSRLWARIPVRYLLMVVDTRHEDFNHLRPALLRFIAAEMPHMLPTLDSLLNGVEQEMKRGRNSMANQIASQISTPLTSAIAFLEKQPIHIQYSHYKTIVDGMALTLEADTPRPISEKLVAVWLKLEALVPRRLYEDTLQLWLNSPQAATTQTHITVDNEMLLDESPLVLFRVDERVLHSPPHLRCLMRMLAFYMDAGRNANNIRLLRACAQAQAQGQMGSVGETEEKILLLKSYIGTQSLVVVQLLLEICDGNGPEIQEIREIACAQIHQMFIADALLPKLVHYNTYPLRLIPVVVQHVPSAHVLIESLNDILGGANLSRRVFGITLMANLIEKYKIPSAFSGVDLICDLLDTLLSCGPNSEHMLLFLRAMPALETIMRVSPFHHHRLLLTLDRVKRISGARVSLYGSEMAARDSPEYLLVELIGQCNERCAG